MTRTKALGGGVRDWMLWSVMAPAAIFVAIGGVVEILGRCGRLAPSIATPGQIAAEFRAESTLLWFHLEPTLTMAGTGLVIALLLSVAAAAACFRWMRLEGGVLTLGAVIDSIPIIAIAPVLAIWLGLSLPMRISLTVMICTFPIVVSLLQGLRSVPQTTDELLTVLAASRWQRFRLIAIQYALPYLFVGLKVAAPLSILGALMAETTGVERGLGAFIIDAMFGMRSPQLWAAVVLACGMSLGFYGVVAAFERLLLGCPAE